MLLSGLGSEWTSGGEGGACVWLEPVRLAQARGEGRWEAGRAGGGARPAVFSQQSREERDVVSVLFNF